MQSFDQRRSLAMGNTTSSNPPGTEKRRQNGAVAVEFAIIMMGAMALFGPVGEFYRLSLFDQALAQATHQAARAVARDPANCEQAITDAFHRTGLARALLDLNEDGDVGIVFVDQSDPTIWPSGSSTEEVQVTVVADNDLFDGTDWEITGGCGAAGSWNAGNWIEVRSRIVVRPWFGPLRALWSSGIRRHQESWARNQA